MTMFKPAIREQIKLRAAIDGPTGSGKTWTALQWARILAGADGNVGLVDTEARSSLRYAPAPGEDVQRVHYYDEPYTFGRLDANPPYSPVELGKLIDAASDELGPDGVLIIDSLTHFWTGEGGTLDIVDQAKLRGAGGMQAWQEGTPAQRFMLDKMLSCSCHLIATMRSKMDYAVEEVTDSKGNRRTTVRRLGLQPEQRAGIEYEFDIVASMDVEHRLMISKTRIPHLADKVAHAGRSFEIAEQLRDWLSTGAAKITDDEAEALVAGLSAIPDPDARRAAKLEFKAEFGSPHDVPEYRGDEAAEWVWGRLRTLGVVMDEPAAGVGDTQLNTSGTARAASAEGDRGAQPPSPQTDNESSATCSSCGAPILWVVTQAGKRMPLDPDGTTHFATCPNADEHRKPKRVRKPKETEQAAALADAAAADHAE